ncbi:hypothetical protein PCANC_09271 [Puccinia coronata f. sp. avenae]|uniref:Uncharacterized protein n=1 Tax=Puccinia coronata f. sp. avenae TaxID=200324 RepID=A0A2N5T316_9BASI|nr:hypothetical protein PCANC_09271 [Puccinia coronata f. sp. avenae]
MRMLSGTSSCLKSYTSGLLWKIPLTPTPVYTYFTHTKQARICSPSWVPPDLAISPLPGTAPPNITRYHNSHHPDGASNSHHPHA